MSTKSKEPARSSPVAPPEELPVGEAVGLVKVGKGWVVVLIQFQGEAIVAKEIYSGPDSRAVATDQAKIALIRHIIAPKA